MKLLIKSKTQPQQIISLVFLLPWPGKIVHFYSSAGKIRRQNPDGPPDFLFIAHRLTSGFTINQAGQIMTKVYIKPLLFSKIPGIWIFIEI